MSGERGTLVFGLCVLPFVVLAALNSGGYRYGASDQAFYQPAVLKQLDPELFPRDTIVLAAQAHLTAADEIIALAVRLAGATVSTAFAVLYVAALVLFAWGVWQIGLLLYRSRWTAAALLAAMTLRHAIARSGTNTLEGYLQPRLIAYALGAVAIAAFLRGRLGGVVVILILAAAVHPTTAVWFGLWLACATAIVRPQHRRHLGIAAVIAAVAAVWALTVGPLAGRLTLMDPEWRRVLTTKDYLFPLQWPVYAWVINLGYLPVILWIHRLRRRTGTVQPMEHALVMGSFSLAAVFAAALVLQAVGVTLAFQLQPARVFWMFDFVATVYAVWAIAEYRGSAVTDEQPGMSGAACRADLSAGASAKAEALAKAGPRLTAIVVVVLSISRGLYVVAMAERPVMQLSIPNDDWGRVMAWARTTPKDTGWLADPMHAVLYGTSVRVAGERDVLVEAVKDAAIGLYDRRIAIRTDERIRAVPDFLQLNTADALSLGAEYGLDFLVTEQRLELPVAFESGALRVYRLQ